MTRMVWKYSVAEGLFGRTMPKGAKVLSVHIQRGMAQMWALVDPTAEVEERQFVAIGTGHAHDIFTVSGRFIGTYVYPDTHEVYHLFEINRT